MQFRLYSLLLLPIVGCQSVSLRSYTAEQMTQSTALAAELTAIAKAQADERRFWAATFTAQEAELMQLQAAVDVNATKVAEGNNHAGKVAAAPANSTSSMAGKSHAEHHKSPLAGVKLNLNPKSAADLIPALAMLKAMYEDGKERIGKLNAREKQLKEKFAQKEADHKKKMAGIEDTFKRSHLSEEFHTNETRDEMRMWKYWEGCRERQHKQFHTSLKIQHATMSKVKTMIDMYEKTISGKADEKAIKKELGQASGGGVPEIVLFQKTWHDTAAYCRDALTELRTASDDFEREISKNEQSSRIK